MKFRINSREFAKALAPSVEIATNGCVKEFGSAEKITLKVDKKMVSAFSYGGSASLIAMISDQNFSSLNFDCKDEGTVTVKADSLNASLTTMHPGDVDVQIKSGELVVSLVSNPSEKRSMGILDSTVKPPNVGNKFDQSIKINREVFVSALQSVLFAPAVEEKLFTYMCVLMEGITDKDNQTLRFSAGTGGRFAVKSVEGKHIFTADEKIKIIFPKANLSNLYKVASGVSSETISIHTVEQDGKNDVPEQIMVKIDGVVMCIFGLENFTKYPDLAQIINYKYPNRIYTDLSEWSYAVGGVNMSYGEHLDDIHNTDVVFNTDESEFMVTPRTIHACTTPISIADDKNDVSVVKGDDIWFRCNSEYLRELMVRGGKTGKVQFNFDSQALLDNIPDDKPKQMKPILIKFPEKPDDARETIENFYMFFTVSTK